MTVDAYAIAAAIAGRYAEAVMGHPAGQTRVRLATATPPSGIRATPAVIVFPDAGELDRPLGNGQRRFTHRFLVRFYLALTVDLARDYVALERWLSLLLYAHLNSVNLGGLVTRCQTTSYRVGTIGYMGKNYEGIELVVEAVTTEDWSPT